MNKKVALGVVIVLILAVFVFFTINWSKEDTLTGEATAEISLLTITVLDEEGELFPEVDIYVNGAYKGATSKFGQSKGKMTVILQEGDNIITVSKENYIPLTRKISYSNQGGQEITLILEKERANLLINVLDKEKPVEGVRVTLYKEKYAPPEYVAFTDQEGVAHFKNIDDFNYTLRTSKDNYLPKSTNLEVNFSRDGNFVSTSLQITPLPHLLVEITDVEGKVLENVEISLYTKENYHSPGAWPLSIKSTDRNGQVEFSYVELEKTYVVLAKKEGFSTRAMEKILLEDAQELRLVLEPLE